MVASNTSKDGGRMEIHMPIPAIDVSSQSTILGYVATSIATLELPPTILRTIVMVTAHSRHHIIGITHEQEGLVKPILVSRPITMGEWRGYNILTHEVPTAILSTIAVITFHCI